MKTVTRTMSSLRNTRISVRLRLSGCAVENRTRRYTYDAQCETSAARHWLPPYLSCMAGLGSKEAGSYKAKSAWLAITAARGVPNMTICLNKSILLPVANLEDYLYPISLGHSHVAEKPSLTTN